MPSLDHWFWWVAPLSLLGLVAFILFTAATVQTAEHAGTSLVRWALRFGGLFCVLLPLFVDIATVQGLLLILAGLVSFAGSFSPAKQVRELFEQMSDSSPGTKMDRFHHKRSDISPADRVEAIERRQQQAKNCKEAEKQSPE